MPRIPAYHQDPYLTELPVRVLSVGQTDDGSPLAVVDDTILYPGGGGQPHDLGWLDGAAVSALETVEEGYRMRVDGPLSEGPASLRLDWGRRYDHMQQHTAQHLLTAVASDRFGWETTSFHLGEGLCDVELDTPSVRPADVLELEAAVAELVRAAVPVGARRVSVDEYRGMEVRSRGLPADHEGDVRLVEIQDVDVTTCAGTHLRSTAEIESLALLGTEGMRGGTRLYWVAGARVRQRLRDWERRARELRASLGVGNDELASAALARSDQLKDALKTVRKLQGDLVAVRARELAAQEDPVASLHLAGWDAAGGRAVAQAFVPLGGSRLALVTVDGSDGAFFAVAAGRGFEGDVAALGAAVAEALGGRGGGSGRLFQGKAASLSARDQAVSVLRQGSKG